MKPYCWELFDAVAAGVKRDSQRAPYMLLYGRPGTGKTTAAVNFAGDRPVYSVTLTGDTVVQELVGHWVPRGQRFDWHDGPVVRAWREGALLVINEIDKAADAVLSVLLAVLDDHEVARLTLPTGETVRPAPRFYAIATSNSPPEALPEALMDRLPVRLEIDQPHPEALERLSGDDGNALRNAVAEAYRSGDPPFTYRQAAAFGTLRLLGVSDGDAAAAVFGNHACDFLNALRMGVRRVEEDE